MNADYSEHNWCNIWNAMNSDGTLLHDNIQASHNITTLIGWMIQYNYESGTIMHALEKPWKYRIEFLAACVNIVFEGDDQHDDVGGFSDFDLLQMYEDHDSDHTSVEETLLDILKPVDWFQKCWPN